MEISKNELRILVGYLLEKHKVLNCSLWEELTDYVDKLLWERYSC